MSASRLSASAAPCASSSSTYARTARLISASSTKLGMMVSHSAQSVRYSAGVISLSRLGAGGSGHLPARSLTGHGMRGQSSPSRGPRKRSR